MDTKYFKICAVVVTFNRKELLLRNIKSLLSQNYPLDILIFDNNSTDGTYEYLQKHNVFNQKNVFYIKSEKNGGGSYGFCKGEQFAYQKGYDYLWLMDDDGYCVNSDTLANLILATPSYDKCILNSYVVCDTETLEPTFDVGEYTTAKEVFENAENGLITGTGNPYNGTLVPCDCFREVGFTDERFFIYGDENDFVYRTQHDGYTWITNANSLYYHPINRNILKVVKFKNISFDIKDQPVWKFYLEIRNTAYLRKKHFNLSIGFRNVIKVFVIAMLSKNKRFKRLYYGLIALSDARKENFDRPIMFNV